ncbi:hypothetical protein F0562_022996 [Nyssa sinensis]|uniref:non-specific serine/threonine protein kinase n=1 Tax=Nyssa sinensis TaxID=561372 RepID=A0A5J5BGP6_9ASTE|nr:hypothetical protein F0562_022996 [Nyssa sinensis]
MLLPRTLMAVKSLALLVNHSTALLLLSLTMSSTFLNLSQSQSDDSPDYYALCAPFPCGNINFSFPFYSSDNSSPSQYECGLPRFQIICDSASSVPSLRLSGRSYRVKDLFLLDNAITVVDNQLIEGLRSGSCEYLRNLSISTSTHVGIEANFILPLGDNFTFFKCPNYQIFSLPNVGNYSCGDGYRAYVRWNQSQLGPPQLNPVETPSGCELMTVPVSGASLQRYGFYNRGESGDRSMEIIEALSDGFPLEWDNQTFGDCVTCQQTDGRCAYDRSSGKITCFCKGGCGPVMCCNWKHVCSASCSCTTHVQVQKENSSKLQDMFQKESSDGR